MTLDTGYLLQNFWWHFSHAIYVAKVQSVANEWPLLSHTYCSLPT